MPTVADIASYLRTRAPLELAESWDNVGLLLGDTAVEVTRLMTCLTVTPTSAAEAIAGGAQMIVTHHPVLFRPVQKLTSQSNEGQVILSLIQAGMAVYSPHTAFDNADGGINDILCNRLGLRDIKPLRPTMRASQCKIVVFVPDGDLGKVSDALFNAGAGIIGQYSQCSFRTTGTGTFHGSEAANPTVGMRGRREEVVEWRLEVVCPEHLLAEALEAMRQAHSYEEPAYDVYSLRPTATTAGAGRLGWLPQPLSLRALAAAVKTSLRATAVQVVGPADRQVHRVAVACGAAGEFLKDAARAGADAFLTGEMRFHECLTAEALGISVLLPGHFATERLGIEQLAEQLRSVFPSLEIWPSRQETDPAWQV